MVEKYWGRIGNRSLEPASSFVGWGCPSLAAVGIINKRRDCYPWRWKSHPGEGKLAGKEEVTIYRGVHCQHPALDQARMGKAVPGNITGTVTPEQHNDGGFSDQSPYTSWTNRKEVADYYARRRSGGQGVILTKTVKHSELVPSPDRMNEGEVFFHGEVSDCLVEEMPGTGPLI